ncbi:unnamed protein product [Psylliodes chrysocephalus]|uniref:Uncharacterized protein n=1 Tax=Psylliodes chrysocephalus TaxID=3402493 RepID=A0A9P0CXA1_9CUCU|nr:unnamed protein product [Psylliodes chrysocephala]
MASKCKLGWAVRGPKNESKSQKSSEQVNQDTHIHEQLNEDEKNYENLQMVKNSLATESFGVLVTPNRLNSENSMALRVMEETIRKCNDRYEIGLLWRGDDVRLPESRTKAIQRLECIKRKCRRN